MKLENLIQFLGYSSIYPPFDKFLLQNGIKWRPSLKRSSPDTLYFIKGQGLSMDFTMFADEDGIQKKSEGSFILGSIEATIVAEKHGAYSGPIPFDVVASDGKLEVEKKIGTPRRRNKETDVYFINGLVWTFAFEGTSLCFIQVDVPTNIWRKHGIC